MLVLASMVADPLGASFRVTAWAIAALAVAGLAQLAINAARSFSDRGVSGRARRADAVIGGKTLH